MGREAQKSCSRAGQDRGSGRAGAMCRLEPFRRLRTKWSLGRHCPRGKAWEGPFTFSPIHHKPQPTDPGVSDCFPWKEGKR